MKNFLASLVLVFVSVLAFASPDNKFTIKEQLTERVQVCRDSAFAQILIRNVSGAVQTGVKLEVTLPTGVAYAGTVFGASNSGPFTITYNSGLSSSTKAVFDIGTIPTGYPTDTLNVRFSYKLNCEIVPQLKNNINPKLGYKVINGGGQYDQITGEEMTVDKATINALSPQSSMDVTRFKTYQRAIVVFNTGYGSITNYEWRDVRAGVGVKILDIKVKGNSIPFTTVGNTVTVNADSAIIASFGNGDRFFDFNEKDTFWETIYIEECQYGQSNIQMYWGCGGSNCDTSTNNFSCIYGTLIPSMSQWIAEPGNQTCRGASAPHKKILFTKNTGTADAIDLRAQIGVSHTAFDAYQSPWWVNNYYQSSWIDTNSFIVKINGNPVSFRIDTAKQGNPGYMGPNGTSCSYGMTQLNDPARRISYVQIGLDSVLHPGDTLTVEYNMYDAEEGTYCCSGSTHNSSWQARALFNDPCRFVSERRTSIVSSVYRYDGWSLTPFGPSDLSDGQTGVFTFATQGWGEQNNFKDPNTSFYEVRVNLQNKLVWDGSAYFQTSAGVNLNPFYTSYNATTGQLIARFSTGNWPAGFSFWSVGTTFYVGATADCAATNPNNATKVNIFLMQDSTCSPAYYIEETYGCTYQVSTVVHCPGCDGCALANLYFDLQRTNFGLPDNEIGGGDGIPDASGSLDMSKVLTQRAMQGDTIEGTFIGRVIRGASCPVFTKGFAAIEYPQVQSNDFFLHGVAADVQIRRGGVVLYNITNIPLTYQSTRKLQVEFSPAYLNSLGKPIPAGLTFDNNDSIIVKLRSKVYGNVRNTIELSNIKTKFFVSEVSTGVNYTPDTFNRACDNWSSNFQFVGQIEYGMTEHNDNVYQMNGCQEWEVGNHVYHFVGPDWWQNTFPYEYRKWTKPMFTSVVKAPGMELLRPRVSISKRSLDANGNNTNIYLNPFSSTFNQPDIVNGDTLTWNIAQYFDNGSFLAGDDGMRFDVYYTYRPTCNTPGNIEIQDNAVAGFKVLGCDSAVGSNHGYYCDPFLPDANRMIPTGFVTNSNIGYSNSEGLDKNNVIYSGNFDPIGKDANPTYCSMRTYHRKMEFLAPVLNVQAPFQNVNAYDNTAQWEIVLANVSTQALAQNVFFYVDTLHPAGIRPLSLKEISTGTIYTPTNGIYQLGSVAAGGAARRFLLTATYYSCNVDSIKLYTGWNCSGYPASWPEYPCQAISAKLTLNAVPQPVEMQMQVLNSPSGYKQFCDTLDYEIEVKSVKTGTAYHNTFLAALGQGVNVIPGTTKLMWPIAGSPGTGTYVPIQDPSPLGPNASWNLFPATPGTSPYPIINNLDYYGLDGAGTGDIDSSRYRIKFRAITSCDTNFVADKKRYFSARANYFCENYSKYSNYARKPSEQLRINNVTANYEAATQMIEYPDILACGQASRYKVRILNFGPGASGNNDFFEIALPQGIAYTYSPPANQMIGSHNIGNVEPYQYTAGGSTFLRWQITPGIVATDSMVFTFYMTASTTLGCDSAFFDFTTYQRDSAFCIADGTPCLIKVATGEGAQYVAVKKPILLITDFSANTTSTCSGELVNTSITIMDSSIAVVNPTPVNISYYKDLPPVGIFGAEDVLITVQSYTGGINLNASVTLTNSFTVPGGNACNILAVLNDEQGTGYNCMCESDYASAYSIRLINAGNDTTVCGGSNAQLGVCPIAGYTYSWSPTTGLSDAAIANPTLSLTNFTTSPVTYSYILNTNRGTYCSSVDTIKITINPQPVGLDSLRNATCSGQTFINNLQSSLVGSNFTWTVNQPASVSGATAGSGTVISQVLTNSSSSKQIVTYTVTPISQPNGCAGNTFTVIDTVKPIPTVSATPSTSTICSGASTNITLSSNVAGATYSWTGSGLNATSGSGAGPIVQTLINGGTATQTATYTVSVTANGCAGASTSVATVDVRPLATGSAVNNASSICSGQQTNITFNCGVTDATCSYSWSAAASAGTITGFSSGSGTSITNTLTNTGTTSGTVTYTITPTANGCPGTPFTTVVTVKPRPTVSALPAIDTICDGAIDNITLSSTVAGTTYSWSGTSPNMATQSGTSNPIANTWTHGLATMQTVTYTITPTADGCVGTSFIATTRVYPTPVASAGPDQSMPACSGTIRTLGGAPTASGGTGSYTYLWSAPATPTTSANPTVTNLGSNTTFTVTVTDALGCSATDEMFMTVTGNSVQAFAGPDIEFCPGATNSQSIGGTPAGIGGQSPYKFKWSPITGLSTGSDTLPNPIPQPTVTTTYTLLVTDNNGCQAVDQVLVTVLPRPTVDAGNDRIVCLGFTATLGAAPTASGILPLSYVWSGTYTGELSSTSSSNPVFTSASSGIKTYYLQVTDGKTCMNFDSVNITVPTQIIITTDSVKSVNCKDGADGFINITVTGGMTPYTYAWSDGAITTQDRTGLAAGVYTVTVSNAASNCSATKTFTVTEPTALVKLSRNKTDVRCYGEANGTASINVTGGTTPYSFNWSNGGSGQSINGLVAGTYYVSVVDAKGCSIKDTFVINQPSLLQVSLSKVNVTCNSSCNGLINTSIVGGTTPYSVLWSDDSTTVNRNSLCADFYTVTVTDKNGCSVESTTQITEPDSIAIIATVTNVACFGSNTGAIDLTVTGGTGAYAYIWSNGLTTQDLSGLSTGTYTVTVKDANACQKVRTFTITQPNLLSVNASKNDVACFAGNNGSITLSITGGSPNYSYLWSDGILTKDRTALAAGNYSVTVKDANNCTVATSLTITQPADSILVSGSVTNVNCAVANTGIVDLTVSGGTAPYSYVWSNGQTTEDIQNLSAGTYSVTVKDVKGCSVVKSFTVTAPAAALTVSHAITNASCNGGTNGAVNITVTGGTPTYTFAWNTGETTEDISGKAAGVYIIKVTDNAGCIKFDTAVINENALFTVTTDSVVAAKCSGNNNGKIYQTVTGGTAPYSHKWNDGATSEDRINLVAGTYIDTIRDLSGCKVIKVYTITQPATLVCSIASSNVSCFGGSDGSAILTVTGGTTPYTYAWSNGATSKDILSLVAGNYSVTVKDKNNCSTICNVTITQPDSLTLAGVTTNVKCYGGNDGAIDITVTGGTQAYSYSWNNGVTIQDLSALISGSYNVVVTDAKGCTKSATYAVTEPAKLNVATNIKDVSCNGGSDGEIRLVVTGGTPLISFEWSGGQTTQNLIGIQAGSTYTVTVKDANNCSVVLSNITVGQPSAPLAFVVDSTKNITCNGDSTGKISITVTGGTPAYSYTWSNGSITQDIAGLPAGSYRVTVTDQNSCTVRSTLIALTQPSNPIAITGVITKPSCNGGTNGAIAVTTTGGTAPYTYLWNDGITTKDRTGIAAGNYTLTVTDAAGCTKVKLFLVNENSTLSASVAKTNVLCYASGNGKAWVTATGGTPGYTYTWSNSSGSDTISGLLPGIYSVTVKDANLCQAVGQVTITQPDSISTLAAVDSVKCFGGSNGNIVLSVAGGTPTYTYQWQDAAITTRDRNNILAGNYTVQIKDANQCSKFVSFVVGQPAELIVIDTVTNVTCAGAANGSIKLGLSGGSPSFTYVWSNTQTTKNISGLAPNTYNLTITDSRNCQTTKGYQITQPDSLKVTFATVDQKCSAANASVTTTVTGGTAPYTYTWSNGATTKDLSGIVAGTYTLSVKDAKNCQTVTTVTIRNICPPVIVDVLDTIPEDSIKKICPPISDINGDPLTIKLINCSTGTQTTTTALGGTGTIVSGSQYDSCFVYQPAPDFHGKDSICVVVCDTTGLCDTGVVVIVVTPRNEPPVAHDFCANTKKTLPIGISVVANTSDPNGDPLTYSYPATLLQPSYGTWTPTGNGSGIYTPNGTCPTAPQVSCVDYFEYVVCDNSAYPVNVLCDTAKICITIMDTARRVDTVNLPPLANNDYTTTTPTTAVTINVKANDFDTNGDNLSTPTVLVGPSISGATVTVNPDGTITYIPNPNQTANIVKDSFQYQICDTLAAYNPKPLCTTAWVYVTINKIDTSVNTNLPPVATDDVETVKDDSCVVINVLTNDYDLDGNTITVQPTLCGTPKNGTLTAGPNGTFLYCDTISTPVAKNTVQKDSFCYIICDNGTPSKCDTAIVRIYVYPVNHKPIAVDDTATLCEETFSIKNVLANDSDIDHDSLTVKIVTNALHGNAVVSSTKQIVYVPAVNFFGKDTVIYSICDNGLNPDYLCDTAIVTYTVLNVNDAPFAKDDTLSATYGVASCVNVLVNDIDVDGDSLSLSISTPPSHGTVTINGSQICYTSAAGYFGPDTFYYRVCDNKNSALQYCNNSYAQLCDIGMVIVNVAAKNNPPVADTLEYSTPKNAPVAVNVGSATSDPDGNPYTITYGQPTSGTWTPTGNGTGIFTPAYGFTGTVTIPYYVCDTSPYPVHVLCDTSVIIIHVVDTTNNNVNHPPLANNDYAVTPKDNPVIMNIKGNDSDPDGNPLTPPTFVTLPENGTVIVNPNGSVTYTPDSGFVGKDSFQYQICDTLALYNPKPLCTTAWAYVYVTGDTSVKPVNHQPIATDDFYTTKKDSTIVINVRSNDSDPDGDSLTKPVIIGLTPTGTNSYTTSNGGIVTVNPDGTISYDPSTTFVGVDSFTYVVCDTLAANDPKPLCDTATVRITVGPNKFNNPPVADTVFASTPINTPVAVNVGSVTSDPDGNPLTYTYGTPSGGGTWTPTGAGTGVFTPTPGFTGTVSIPYVVCDLSIYPINVLCDTSYIIITIRDTSSVKDTVNLAPIASNDYATTTPGGTTTINVKANDSDPNGDLLTKPTIQTNPTSGATVVVNPDGSIKYTAPAGFCGKDSFSYQVCDTLAKHLLKPLCDVAWVYVTTVCDSVTNVNHPPVATDDFATTGTNTPVVIKVKANDSDPDGDSLTVVNVITQPTQGTYNPTTGVYTPNPGYVGKDSFVYVICDTLATESPKPLCDTAKVIITVNPTIFNNPPVADTVFANTAINTPVAVNVGSATSDPDGNPLTYTYGTPSGGGTWTPTGSNGTGVFTPTPGFTGTVSIPYYVCDTSPYTVHVLCDTSYIIITIRDTSSVKDTVNLAPVASNDYATTTSGNSTTINVRGNDSDPNLDLLSTPTIVTNPTSGATVVVNPDGTIKYTAPTGFCGKDSFSYQVCDSLAKHLPRPLCDIAWVYVTTICDTFTNVNHPPVATDDFATTDENVPVVINVRGNDSDVDGDSLTKPVIIDTPNHGTVTVDPITGIVTYTPDSTFSGTDTFVYVVCDTLAIELPRPLCDTARVIITVKNVINNPIVANYDTTKTTVDVPVVIPVLTNDTDPDNNIDTSSITVTDSTNHGTVHVNPDGSITYTPNPGYIGKDTFIYKVCDKGTPVYCDTAIVFINVTSPVNNPPVADTVFANTPINTPVAVNVGSATSDPDGNPLTYTYGTPSGGGTWTPTGSNGTGVFTPTPGFTGTVSIPYYVCDTSPYLVHVLCDTSYIIITIRDTSSVKDTVNLAPIASNDYATTTAGSSTTINVKANDSDPNADLLTNPTIQTVPAHGTATVNPDGTIKYTPSPWYCGKDSFSYQVCDSLAKHLPRPLCDIAWVYVTTICDTTLNVNHPPVATDDYATTNDTTTIVINVRGNDSDVDGDSLTIPVVIVKPPHGTVTVDTITGLVTYVPDSGYYGIDTFVYVICDTLATRNPQPLCDTAKVTINITPAIFNHPPVADTVFANTAINTPVAVNVGSATSDPDGNPLTYTYGTPSGGGTWTPTGSNGTGVFTPNPGFTGTVSIPYYVCDTSPYPVHVLCDTSYIIITIRDTSSVKDTVNLAPVASNDYATTTTGSSTTINVRGNDSDPNLDLLTIPTIQTAPTKGTATVNPDGTIKYTPFAGNCGKDSFSYQVCDSLAKHLPRPLCDIAWVYVYTMCDTFTNVNHPPVATDDFATTDENVPVVINVRGNDSDVDGDSLTIPVVIDTPNHGTVTVDPITGVVTYVPNTGYVGKDTFEYVICDTLASELPRPLCDTARVIITIKEFNTPPVILDTTVIIPEQKVDTICPIAYDIDTANTLNFQLINCDPASTSALSPIINPTTGCVIVTTPDVATQDTFKLCVVVCDDGSPVKCDTGTITIIVPVTPVCPIAMDDYVSGTNSTPITINELSNDNLGHTVGTGLTVSIVKAPTSGTATVNTNGTINYVSNGTLNGFDTISYLVCDTVAKCCDTGNIIVTIVNYNVPPVAANDYDTLCEESTVSVNVKANDFDANSPLLAVSIVTGPKHGNAVVNAADSTILYVPNTNFFGSDSVIYSVCDTGNLCDTATLYLTVLNRNDVPIAIDDTASVLEDGSVIINVTLNDSDADNDVLTVSISAQPANGTVILSGNNIKYTPKKDFCGADTFGYRVCGQKGNTLCPGDEQCDLALVIVNVQCVNDTPVAPIVIDSIPEDSTIVICPPVSDVDGDHLIVVPFVCNETGILHGTLTPRTPTDSCYIYTPMKDWHGIDTICYVVCDTNALYNPKPLCDTSYTIIVVTPVNEPPVAANIYTGTPKDQPVSINVASSTSDPNGDPLTYTYPNGTTTPYGTWTPTGNGAGVYTPNPGFVGTDSFPYIVCDNSPNPVHVLCDTAYIYVTIIDPAIPINHAPIANTDYGVTDPVTRIIIDILSNDFDPDGDNLTHPKVLTNPMYGTVQVNTDGTATYNPYGGPQTYPAGQLIFVDSFQYMICDTNALYNPQPLCDTTWAYITINLIDSHTLDVNHKPTAADDYATTTHDSTIVIHIMTNDSDPDGDDIEVTAIPCLPAYGTATIDPVSGNIIYNPYPGMAGPNANKPDTFCYVICDITSVLPNPLCDTARVIITVPNSVVAVNDTTVTGKGVPVIISVKNNDYDPEKDSFFVTQVVTQPSHGTATLNPVTGTITYVSTDPTFCGTYDTFTYAIKDTLGAVDTATVYVYVDCCNKPTMANDDDYTMNQGDTLRAHVINNDSYTSPYPQKATVVQQPTHGTISVVNDTVVVYTPSANYCGKDFFKYVLSNICGTDTANVNVTINCVAPCHHPEVRNDYVSICIDSVANINALLNDSNLNSTSHLVISNILYDQTIGTVTKQNDTSILFKANHTGTFTLAYIACDTTCHGTTLCDMGRITIFVHDSCRIVPIVTPIVDTTIENKPIVVCIDATNIAYNNIEDLVITDTCSPTNGTLVFDSLSTCFTYVPDSGFVGNDTFCITICDTSLVPQNCITVPVVITVLPVDSEFVDAVDNVVFTEGNTPVVVNVLANDTFGPNPGNTITGTSIHVTGATNGTHGTTVVNPNGTITYTPDSGFCGVDSFRYGIADNGTPVQVDTAMVYVYVCDTPRPVANNDGNCVTNDTTTTIGSAVNINVLGNDYIPAGSTNTTVTVIKSPSNGTAVVQPNGSVLYTPNDGYVGGDELEYQLCVTVLGVTYCDTAKVCIYIADTPRAVVCYYPNGFSPNGDGINETYVVPCNEEHLKNGPTSLKVYNRWGDEVWRSLGNYQNDFAGKNQQTITLPDGTYYFIYKYVNAAGKEESVAKFMVIHRE